MDVFVIRQDEPQANCEKHEPISQVKHVEHELVRASGEDVMDPQNLVIDQALEEIEQAGPRKQRAKKDPPAPSTVRIMRGSEQECRPDHENDPESQVKITILCILKLKLLNG